MGRGHADGHKNKTQRGTGGRAWSFTDCMAGEISPKMCIMMTGSSRGAHGCGWLQGGLDGCSVVGGHGRARKGGTKGQE